MSQFVLPSHFFLPSENVKLGRFVVNRQEPHDDFHDFPSPAERSSTTRVQTQLESSHQAGHHGNGECALTDHLSTKFSSRLGSSIQVTADEVKTYYLQNSGQWLRDATKSAETREWIQQKVNEGEETYMTVGYQTLSNAVVIEQAAKQTAKSATVEMPLSALLGSFRDKVRFAEVVNVGIHVPIAAMDNKHTIYRLPGECVCAVQYRQLTWKWFSWKRVDTVMLDKVCWEVHHNLRSLDAPKVDSIEVELADMPELKDGIDEYVFDPETPPESAE